MTDDKSGAAGGMESSARASSAKDQLNLILSFFPRVDTKLSVVLGVDVGMLGLLMSKAPPALNGLTGWAIPALALFGAAMILSLYRLYRGAFPDIENTGASLVFFGDIAKLKMADFLADYSKQSTDELADALLGQAWRNAVILSDKFSNLKSAYRATVLGIAPWIFCLYVFLQLPALAKP
jgi:hypothetical protein